MKIKKQLNDLILENEQQLEAFDIGTEEYNKRLETVTKLIEARTKLESVGWKINPDTILELSTNVLMTLMIIFAEQIGGVIVNSKAFSFIGKKFLH